MNLTSPPKTFEKLRKSAYHQELGRKLCAALVAQQQGIQMNTAFRKVEEPVGDLWLQLAETILEARRTDRSWHVGIAPEASGRVQ